MDQFKVDPNVLSFIVFGSLVRGNWDDNSDLDLDVIVSDDNNDVVQKEIEAVLQNLTSVGFSILTSFAEVPNEQKIILETLDRIEIRFHKIADTNINITKTMQILYGDITKEQILNATVEKKTGPNFALLNNKFLELSIYVPVCLKRGNIINAQFFLNKMRQTLIQIYVLSHNLDREFDFEQSAGGKLVSRVKETYCVAQAGEIKLAFEKLLTLYESNIAEVSADKITLSKDQQELLQKVRKLFS